MVSESGGGDDLRHGPLYRAASIAGAQTVTVKATSTADSTKFASATVTLTPPVTISVTPASATVTASQTWQFTASVGGAANNGVTWTLNPNVGTISAAGLYSAPASIATAQTVTVKATSVADSSKAASATITLNPTVTISLTPLAAGLTASQTQQYTATVRGTFNGTVTWALSPAVGTISASGLFTAPAAIARVQTVTVKATSIADSTKSATATVALNPPVAVSLMPSTVSLLPSQTQTFTATVSGTSNAAVTWSIDPTSASLVSAGTAAVYVAPSTAPTAQSVKITAASVADPSKAATAVITLPQVVTVSLGPPNVSLAPSGTQSFTATLLGTSNTAVTWSISPPVGTISPAGLYTAPSSITTPQMVAVTAQSAADPTKSASSLVSLQTAPFSAPVSPGASFTYYVDATIGSDSNPGSQAAPWKTIAKVNSANLTPGQSVGFARGSSWREALIVPSSGSAGSPITFGAYGTGATPVINGEPAGIFTATAETGDTSEWTSVATVGTSTFSATSASLYRGNYGFDAASDGNTFGYATKTIAAQTDLYLKFSVFVPTTFSEPADYDYTYVMDLRSGATSKYRIYLQQYGNQYQLQGQLNFGTYTHYGSSYLTKGAWHRVDVHYVADASAGGFQIWIDGVSMGALFNQNSSGSIDTIQLGMISQTVPTAGSHLYFDNVKFATSSLVPPANAVDINGKSYVTMQDLEVADAGDVGVILRGKADYNTIQRLAVRDVDQNVGYQSGILIDGGSNNLVANNTVYNSTVGIQVSGYGSVVSDFNTISGNTVHNVNDAGISSGPAGGRNPNGTLVKSNIVYKGAQIVDDRPGIMFSGAGQGTIASYNTIYNIGTATTRGEGIEADTATVGVQLFYNVIYGCTNGGIGLTSIGHFVYANTTYNNNTEHYDAGELQIWGSGTNMTIKDNLFYASPGKHLLIAGSANLAGAVLNYNGWYSDTATPFQWGTAAYNYVSYTAVAGQDANSLTSDPLFTNPATGDFTLRAGSPAVGAGVFIPGVSTATPPNIGSK